MDALTALLEGPKARGAFLLRSVFNPPWALRVEDQAPVSVVTVVRGEAWLLPAHATPARLSPGDVVAIRGPGPYTLADSPETPIEITVGPEQRCTTSSGRDVTESMSLGVRTWGESLQEGSTVILSGTYQAPSEVGRHLLASMPELLVQPAGVGGSETLVSLLATELNKEELGQEIMLDRLLDLLLVNVLRTWLTGNTPDTPTWYRAQSDPVVGTALRLMQEEPARPWTVASLASAVGVSRAALARRFNALVGQPPMAYLTNWRLTLAVDLLDQPDATVATVARQVGYGSAFAFSTAFKRSYGVSPQEYRGGTTELPQSTAAPRTLVLSH
ncbi:AraC family transcriptional regulator [Lipingzhangella sp. LS1_29]|uniref:AraC family transcriptional regulator n=2 Tax=Lipingzhangella rawalii TaxID=2055835 RepID=A0ABU2HB02_9ACTN|nr:AraC family transcriptional regulator [Lipingzhangella rawalii]